MKTLKVSIHIFIIICATLIVGCNNELLSPASSNGIANTNEFPLDSKFRIGFTLNPYQTYSLHYGNTGLSTFNSISINGCSSPRIGLEIIGYMDDELILLNCNSNNFEVFSIDIRNLTGGVLVLEVVVTGTRFKRNIITTGQ